MQLYFDHILGKQQDSDIIYSLVSATFPPEEWYYAFSNGWAPTSMWYPSKFNDSREIIWYQSRQVRINLNNYKPNKKTKKLQHAEHLTIVIADKLLEDIDAVYEIYVKYCTHKNFTDVFNNKEQLKTDLFSSTIQKDIFIHFYYKNKFCAVTKISVWDDVPFTEFFWWDYEYPSLSLGKLSAYLEIEEARKLNSEHLYIGFGYNSDCIYKSLKNGFEFWTGRYWCDDKEIFTQLCNNDDTIINIKELDKYQEKYLALLGV